MHGASRTPRTLHFTNAWHATSGGISTFYRELMRYAGDHGRAMTLVVPGESTRTEDIGENIRICHIAADLSRMGGGGYRVMWPWGPGGQAIRTILRSEQPDLVEISDKYGLAMIGGLLRGSLVRGIRLRPVLLGVSHERMHDNVAAYLGLGGLGRWVSRTHLKRYYWLMFDHHAANSAYTANELVPASRDHRVYRWLHVLPMGVDSASFDPADRTAEARCALALRAGCPCDSRLLMYVGRLAQEKNLPLLVDTLERLPDSYHLTVAGDGKLREWLLDVGNRRTGQRIHWLGHLKTRRELASALAGADVFVHPNAAEPFGIAPLEAMAAGTPVVLPTSGGVLSYASEENAWLADPEGESFARRISELFATGPERERRAAAGRRTAVAHDWSRVAERWFGLYDAAVAGLPIPAETPASD
ncbi:MAG TPA: glycosyltransferase [Bryobacteraceae bacterium]|nr:glycosyltransferase [Bryobacteraceae bacterium]